MSPEWVNIVPYAISTLFLLALLLFLFAIYQLWRGRNTAQYRSSREADRRGRRLFLISLSMFVIVLVLSAAASFAVIAVGGIDALLGRLPPTPTPASTPYATLDPSLPQPILTISAADAVITPQNKPVEPRTTFETGIKRIYFFIHFEHMNSSLIWSRALYRDGEFVYKNDIVWNMGESGDNFFFFELRNGYAPGAYEVRLLVNDQVTSTFKFTVSES